MEISAYKLAQAFGIDALAIFWSVENAAEIQKVREEHASLQNDVVILKSFNDGNNTFEVSFNVETFECYRSDHGGVKLAMQDYLAEKVAILTKRDDLQRLFGLECDNLLRFIKANK